MSNNFRVIDSKGCELAAGADWEHRVAGIRGFLHGRGIVHGDRILAWLPRGWEEGALCQAAMELGCVWVSVPRRSTPVQVAQLLEDAEPAVAVCGAGENGKLGDGPWIEWPDLVAAAAQTVDIPAKSGAQDDLAALCYTSGSTGRPKGVMVSHGNLDGALVRIDSYLRHTPEDRVLALMPLNSPWGLLQWRVAVRAGAGIVLPPAALMAAELVRTIRAAQVTGLAGLPPTWVQLVEYLSARGESLPELRYVTTSGGSLPKRILDLFPIVFPRAEIWMTYGLTEAFRTTVLSAADFAERRGSLGKPCPDVGIALLKADGTLAEPGESGELVHSGDCVTHGYWRRPELTAKAFAIRPGHEMYFNGRRVHYSGDRVRRDPEGFLWFEGREDGLIKSGGYRISSDEIEEALLAVAGVTHAVAGGIPDEALGHRIAAAIEVDASAGEGIVERVRAALRLSLASHQQPHVLHVWDQLMPLNSNGKLDRPRILAHLVSGGY